MIEILEGNPAAPNERLLVLPFCSRPDQPFFESVGEVLDFFGQAFEVSQFRPYV